jgi:DNA polymerase beta
MTTDYKPIILQELDTMRKADLAEKRIFQAKAYKKAMDEISSLSRPVSTLADLEGLEGIGAKIREKIAKILETGALPQATKARQEMQLDAMDALQGVHGIGAVKAKALIAAGIKSIADLRAAFAADSSILNDTQQMGLRYYDDAVQRIPRAEMEAHEAKICSGLNPAFRAMVVGSYRRGATDSGDIDVLLTLPSTVPSKLQGTLFLKVVEQLTTAGYIIDKLSQGPKKFLGYVRLGPGYPARRLDLLMTPEAEFAYAIFYFTGSQAFNVAFRKHCLKNGYTINEHTMVPTGDKAVPPPMKTEEDIFRFFGLKYVAPAERKGEKNLIPV